MNEGFGVGTEGETQCVAKAASADCEYSIGVGTPGQHANVTIPHEMRLGTGGMQPGEATKDCDNLNIVIGTPIQHLAVTTTNNLDVGTADLTQGVATLVCATRSPSPTESGPEGDSVQRLNFGLGNMYDKVETGLVQGLASGVGTHELNPLVVTEDSETKRNSRSVATNLIDGLPTKGLGIECMVQGLRLAHKS